MCTCAALCPAPSLSARDRARRLRSSSPLLLPARLPAGVRACPLPRQARARVAWRLPTSRRLPHADSAPSPLLTPLRRRRFVGRRWLWPGLRRRRLHGCRRPRVRPPRRRRGARRHACVRALPLVGGRRAPAYCPSTSRASLHALHFIAAVATSHADDVDDLMLLGELGADGAPLGGGGGGAWRRRAAAVARALAARLLSTRLTPPARLFPLLVAPQLAAATAGPLTTALGTTAAAWACGRRRRRRRWSAARRRQTSLIISLCQLAQHTHA